MESIYTSPNLGIADSFNYTNQFDKNDINDLVDETFGENLQQAPIDDPAGFCHHIKMSSGSEKKLMDFMKGTTCLGFRFKHGVMLAVDSRASQGTFDASEAVRKVIEINEFLLGTMAGGAADCLFWEQYLAVEARKYQLRHGERVTVAAASRMLINILYNYRNRGLSMGVMLAGFDKAGGHLYYLDDDGTRVYGNIFSVGSGSTYAYGVLDTKWKYDMSIEEAYELGREAIYHATYRDAGSGGVVRIYHVHEHKEGKGWTKLLEGEDVNQLHYHYAEKRGFDPKGDDAKANLL